jgi:hypothetical protein
VVDSLRESLQEALGPDTELVRGLLPELDSYYAPESPGTAPGGAMRLPGLRREVPIGEIDAAAEARGRPPRPLGTIVLGFDGVLVGAWLPFVALARACVARRLGDWLAGLRTEAGAELRATQDHDSLTLPLPGADAIVQTSATNRNRATLWCRARVPLSCCWLSEVSEGGRVPARAYGSSACAIAHAAACRPIPFRPPIRCADAGLEVLVWSTRLPSAVVDEHFNTLLVKHVIPADREVSACVGARAEGGGSRVAWVRAGGRHP